MALLKDGGIAGQLSGRLGSIVFARNRYGSYIRNGTIPITSTTEYAIEAKARMTRATQNWQDRSAAEKKAWTHFAQSNPVPNRLGDMRELTGHAAYVGNQIRRELCGFGALATPPITPPPEPFTSISLNADIGAGNVEIVFAPTPTPALTHILLLACKTNSNGINYVENLKRFCGVAAPDQASPWDIEALITARLGAITEDQTLTVFAAKFSSETGLLSAYLRSSAVVVDTV